MRLREYDATLEEKMSEFDLWITPTLGEIRETSQFRENLEELKAGFDILNSVTHGFTAYTSCASNTLAVGICEVINHLTNGEAQKVLGRVCNVFLLATGKTDNNLKCQFPILLRNTYKVSQYPKKKQTNWVMTDLPRTLSMDEVTKLIVQLKEKREFQELLMRSYFHLIISDEVYAKQLWSLGHAYCIQKQTRNEDYLLSSMVVFQSRGSITATQGHIPEVKLREYMNDWGLISGTDFNEQDVEIGELLEGMQADDRVKKRKYDFIIPYRSRRDGAKIFIQSQFYAGDSGSVSHKVVDQTDSARTVTLQKYPRAVFIEYLDGAGYYSSLNGDLRKMLSKPTTKDFIQIKTAPIKLRRELQSIGFLTTLEIEHAILRTTGSQREIEVVLNHEGYTFSEISNAVSNAIENGEIERSADGVLSIREDRISIVRKYCLLDLIANYGSPIPDDRGTGCLTVAGYSHSWGITQAELVRIAVSEIPNLDLLWKNTVEPFEDIQWLMEHELIKAR